MRSVLVMLPPKRLACTTAVMNVFRSSTPVRLPKVIQRFQAGFSQTDLVERLGEFLGEGPLDLAHRVSDGGVKTHARLHADRKNVDRVGQVGQDLLLPGPHFPAEHELRQDVSADRAEQ